MSLKEASLEESGNDSSQSFGQKHLIKCRCVLPQMKSAPIPVQHHFLVFSEVVNGEVKPKYTQCNNCGVVHKVIDICTSEIVGGKEDMGSIIEIDDIRLSMNSKLSAILDRHKCDLPTWEHAQYIVENKKWGEIVVLTNDADGNSKIVKYVRIISDGLYKIDSHTRNDVI